MINRPQYSHSANMNFHAHVFDVLNRASAVNVLVHVIHVAGMMTLLLLHGLKLPHCPNLPSTHVTLVAVQ
ncbi:MAG: hypothetical protein EKK61_04240 [Rickettsiales bacterium]|nr:MAG: hypothetical protein EKK61_04240 [Rickettsiales bacterium]